MAQLGARVNGIHEVTGSIPVSSTKSINKLAATHPEAMPAVSILCLFKRAAAAQVAAIAGEKGSRPGGARAGRHTSRAPSRRTIVP